MLESLIADFRWNVNFVLRQAKALAPVPALLKTPFAALITAAAIPLNIADVLIVEPALALLGFARGWARSR